MSTIASINIEAMRSALSTMQNAGTDFRGIRTSLSGTLSGARLSTSAPNPLLSVAYWCDNQVPPLARRLALAEALSTSNPGFDGTVEIDENDLSTLSPYQARQQASEIATAINNGEELTDEQLAILLENAHDPYFAVELTNQVDPESMADFAIHLSAQVDETTMYGQVPDGVDSQEWIDGIYEQYSDTLEALGTVMGTASRSTDPAMRAGYLDEVIDVMTNPDGHPLAPVAMSVLLSHGSFSEHFGNSVAEAVYNYERSDEFGTWRDQAGNFVFRMPGGEARTDGMAGVMAMLGNSPEAAQKFFSGGPTVEIEVDGQTMTVTERLDYLIQQRTWSESYLSDEGDGLGAALVAATTTFRNRGQSGRTSASLATQTFGIIAAMTGDQGDTGLWGHRDWLWMNDNGQEMHMELRGHVADMLAEYAPDMFRVVGDGGSNDDLSRGYSWSDANFPPDMPYGALLTDGVIAQLMFTLGQDPEHVTTVGGGWAAANQVYMTYQMERALENDPEAAVAYLNGNLASLDNHAGSSAQVLDFIMDYAFIGDDADAEMAAARAKAYKDVLSAASAIPVFKPAEVLGEWGGFAFSQARTHALDAIGNSGSGAADTDELSAYREEAAEGAMQTYMNLLLAHGYFDPEVIEQVNETPGMTLESPHDTPGLITTDDDGNMVFNVDHRQYQSWLLDNSRTSDIRQTIIAAFGLEPR